MDQELVKSHLYGRNGSTIAFALITLLSTWGPCHAQDSIILAENGEPRAVIVKEAFKDERLLGAIDDLQAYLKKATDAEFKVIDSEDRGVYLEKCRIYLGKKFLPTGTPLNLCSGAAGYLIVTDHKNVYIAAHDEEGVANGIYGFIKKYMRVRWYMPGEIFERVPKIDLFKIDANLLDRAEPSFQYRGFSGMVREARPWFKRQRIGGQKSYAFHHNCWAIYPPSKYQDHPEYYSLVDGQRTVPQNDKDWWFQPCTSNPEVINIAARAAQDYFDKNPDYQTFSLGANDRPDFCGCENCMALDVVANRDFRVIKNENGRFVRMFSERYFHFFNEVARRVQQTNPGKLVGTLAYLATELPPLNIDKLESNTVIFLTQDDSQHYNTFYRELDRKILRQWAATTNHLGVYVYYGLAYITPRYYPHMAADYLKYAHSQGADGFYAEVYPNWPYYGPQVYVISELLWDIDQDTDQLLDDFFDHLFGKAGGDMKQFYEMVEGNWMSQQHEHPLFFYLKSNPQGQMNTFRLPVVKKLKKCLLSAEQKVSDPVIRKRINFVRRGYEYLFTLVEIEEGINSLKKIKIQSKDMAEKALSTVKIFNLAEIKKKIKDAHDVSTDNYLTIPDSFKNKESDRFINFILPKIKRIKALKEAEAKQYLYLQSDNR